MTPQQLLDRFRRDVDDLDFDSSDQSDLLWSDDDVMHYMEEAHRQLVSEARYLHKILEIPVTEGYSEAALPGSFLQLRGDKAFLRESRTTVVEREMAGFSGATDDYNQTVPSNPFVQNSPPGRPRIFSLDMEDATLVLFPTPDRDDLLELPAYVEPPRIEHAGKFAISNESHQLALLDGMKALAYRKQDADAYDPGQAERWQLAFEDKISAIKWERMRRRRKPGAIQYGGI